MFLLSKLWYLVSMAILEFENWKTRRKKSVQVACIATSLMLFKNKIILVLLAINFSSVQGFSSFQCFSTKISMVTESESSPGTSYAYSTLRDKTSLQRTSQIYFKNQVFLLFSNMASTETENSISFEKFHKTWNIPSCSSEYSLNFTCSVVTRRIYGSVAVNFSKLSNFPRSRFIESSQPRNSNNSPVFSTFGHGFSILVIISLSHGLVWSLHHHFTN